MARDLYVQEFIIRELQKHNVQLIFSIHGQEKSLHEIARTLTLHKIPTKRGGQWHPSTVRKILSNQIYAGIYNYNGIKSQKKELQLI